MSMLSQKCMSATFAALLLLALPGTAQRKARVTGFYSDMHYVEEAGDVIGMEVWIVYARGGYWATVQLAEGEPDRPVVVPVQVSGQHVGFSIELAKDSALRFAGTTNGVALTGLFGTEYKTLKRKNSYWQ